MELSLKLDVKNIDKSKYPDLKATVVIKSDAGVEIHAFAGQFQSV
jgi:hypothetical protein